MNIINKSYLVYISFNLNVNENPLDFHWFSLENQYN